MYWCHAGECDGWEQNFSKKWEKGKEAGVEQHRVNGVNVSWPMIG